MRLFRTFLIAVLAMLLAGCEGVTVKRLDTSDIPGYQKSPL